MFGGISLLGMIILAFILPETKGKTLEEIQELFMSKEYKRKHYPEKSYGVDNSGYASKEPDTKL